MGDKTEEEEEEGKNYLGKMIDVCEIAFIV